MDSTEKFTLCAIDKDNLFHTAEDPVSADGHGRFEVKRGDFIIDAVRYSCVSPGGTVFTPTGRDVMVPTRAI